MGQLRPAQLSLGVLADLHPAVPHPRHSLCKMSEGQRTSSPSSEVSTSFGGLQKLQSNPSAVAAPIAEPPTVGAGEAIESAVIDGQQLSEAEGCPQALVGEDESAGKNDEAVSTAKHFA